MSQHLPEFTSEREAALRELFTRIAFVQWLGLELGTVGPGSATVHLPILATHKQNLGIVHGGAIAALIDTAAAFATLSVLQAGEKTTTTDLSIQYLRPLTEGRATARATVRRAGRRVIALAADVYDADERLAATALATYLRFV